VFLWWESLTGWNVAERETLLNVRRQAGTVTPLRSPKVAAGPHYMKGLQQPGSIKTNMNMRDLSGQKLTLPPQCVVSGNMAEYKPSFK